MSHHDFLEGRDITMRPTISFYGIIQAAMREADTDNLELLKAAWPTVWEEFQLRRNAQGGYLPEEWPQRN